MNNNECKGVPPVRYPLCGFFHFLENLAKPYIGTNPHPPPPRFGPLIRGIQDRPLLSILSGYVELNLSPTSVTGRANRLRAAHDVHPVREVRQQRRRDVRTALSPAVLRRNQGERHIAHGHAITREFSSLKTRGVYIVCLTTSNDQYMRTCAVCARKFR